MTDDLRALAERLEKATEGLRELDAIIECLFPPKNFAGETLSPDRHTAGYVLIDTGEPTRPSGFRSEMYTSSLDAAVALCERCECDVELCLLAAISALHGATITTDALARQVCLMIVRARLAQDQGDRDE